MNANVVNTMPDRLRNSIGRFSFATVRQTQYNFL